MANGEYENPYQDKIDKDEENLVNLRAGTANQQLLNAAYLGARQEPSEVMTWMNAAESGLTSFKTAIDESKKARQLKLDEMNGKIDVQIEALETSGYSLGENYYKQANIFTKELREEYLAAEGSPDEQKKLKMELNIASQNIANVKNTIEEIGTAWASEDIEKLALNPKEQRVMEIAMDPKGTHAFWIEGENTFGWKDPKSGEVYTVKQVQDIQKMASKDYVAKEEYITKENDIADAGNNFRTKGIGNTFNKTEQMYLNKKLITKENIRFFINGDFTGDGTPSFKDAIIDHPEWDSKIFDYLTEHALAKYDTYPSPGGDGKVNEDDFRDAFYPVSTDLSGVTYSREKGMNQVYNSIIEAENFDVTKGLIAEYMTLRQQERFYGGKAEFDKMKGMSPKNFDSWDAYVAAGGNMGYAVQVLGWTRLDAKYDKKGRLIKKEEWYQDKNVAARSGESSLSR